MTDFRIKRPYDDPAKSDGYRVLVDRLWPRGVSKEQAELDEWNKDLAPSNELRKWFDHREDRFEEFAERYRHELSESPAVTEALENWEDEKTVTLLYAAKDPEINHAVILRDFLADHAK